jgi:hypothetical protein
VNNRREETGSGSGPQSAKQRTTKFISMEEAAELERRQAEVNWVSETQLFAIRWIGVSVLAGLESPGKVAHR